MKNLILLIGFFNVCSLSFGQTDPFLKSPFKLLNDQTLENGIDKSGLQSSSSGVDFFPKIRFPKETKWSVKVAQLAGPDELYSGITPVKNVYFSRTSIICGNPLKKDDFIYLPFYDIGNWGGGFHVLNTLTGKLEYTANFDVRLQNGQPSFQQTHLEFLNDSIIDMVGKTMYGDPNTLPSGWRLPARPSYPSIHSRGQFNIRTRTLLLEGDTSNNFTTPVSWDRYGETGKFANKYFLGDIFTLEGETWGNLMVNDSFRRDRIDYIPMNVMDELKPFRNLILGGINTELFASRKISEKRQALQFAQVTSQQGDSTFWASELILLDENYQKVKGLNLNPYFDYWPRPMMWLNETESPYIVFNAWSEDRNRPRFKVDFFDLNLEFISTEILPGPTNSGIVIYHPKRKEYLFAKKRSTNILDVFSLNPKKGFQNVFSTEFPSKNIDFRIENMTLVNDDQDLTISVKITQDTIIRGVNLKNETVWNSFVFAIPTSNFSTTSTTQVEGDIRSLDVFPNPSSSSWNIEIPEDGEMSIMDIHGRVVKVSVVRKSDGLLNVNGSEFPSGVYFGKWKGEKGDHGSFKLVKL
jgi:hypothetical protein